MLFEYKRLMYYKDKEKYSYITPSFDLAIKRVSLLGLSPLSLSPNLVSVCKV